MVSPALKRINISPPSKKYIASPRGNTHGRKPSNSDFLCAMFLRYTKWITLGILGIAMTRMISMDSTVTPIKNGSTRNWDLDSNNPEIPGGKASSGNYPEYVENHSYSNGDHGDHHHQSPLNEKVEVIKAIDQLQGTATATITNNHTSESQSGKPSDLLSKYNPLNAPVILDGWNRTVQVHLIVDVTGGEDINPASKLLLSAVQRSKYTQLKAVTFVRPSIETIDFFSRKPGLPLLFLVDWGSMDRDCHRLQLTLENIREQEKNHSKRKREKEQPYFLLIDSSGSTRRTGCSYLFVSNSDDRRDSETAISYARANDNSRIRLAKRSIVQNRFYDRRNNKVHLGDVSPNQWDGAPSDYSKPILHSPFALRESFVMSIQNITKGKRVSMNDSKRTVDVGFFWKSGDYSHYGFYRRDIGKVVKTLHHSSINKEAGTRMENLVQISYTDEKGMEAGNVQYKYTMELLRCKIVVIAQRDEWEDHFRLMESLASGALVMTDRMVALPAGLEDKVNIVIYDNPKMLKDLIKYYTKPKNKNKRKRIALKGYNLVMGRHRSWHRLEELLFGRPLTNVDQPDAPAPKKGALPTFKDR
ncbi:unnamed protein product [Pseudo-nitzschia multistriata]|uniref:Spore protein YkvP/CgeB glycosyl transferase-like domain-containing protein n=1 Tax=Pseudo-nitzschia multistriata TaxID=183589 RepID=A0A448ZST9_9STRA|nr:unnamed protein product [Pseudo-nitzschia multistriata]